MLRARYLSLFFLGLTGLTTGCLALSFGGRTQTVEKVVSESPETISRLESLENRVKVLEQQLIIPQETLPGSVQLK